MIVNKKVLSAPIQGWTDHVWRVAHAQVFGGVDAYHAPFMRVEHGVIRPRDLRDILPENNEAIHVVPQVLACRPADMRQMLSAIADMGYDHVSVNLGCPHPPVARKGYGCGMLTRPDDLRTMFDVLNEFDRFTYSLKTRLGWDDTSQWRTLVKHLDDSRVTDVVMHYRTGTQQHKGEAMLEHVEETISTLKTPVIINGDIDSPERAAQLMEQHPTAAGVMIGRALVADPALLCPERATMAHYRTFHDMLYEQYRSLLTGGDHQVLARMQSLWERMLPAADHRALKAIRKATTLARYDDAVAALLHTP